MSRPKTIIFDDLIYPVSEWSGGIQMHKDKYVVICDEPVYDKTYTYTTTTFKDALKKALEWNQFYHINCCRIAKVVVDYGQEIL